MKKLQSMEDEEAESKIEVVGKEIRSLFEIKGAPKAKKVPAKKAAPKKGAAKPSAPAKKAVAKKVPAKKARIEEESPRRERARPAKPLPFSFSE